MIFFTILECHDCHRTIKLPISKEFSQFVILILYFVVWQRFWKIIKSSAVFWLYFLQFYVQNFFADRPSALALQGAVLGCQQTATPGSNVVFSSPTSQGHSNVFATSDIKDVPTILYGCNVLFSLLLDLQPVRTWCIAGRVHRIRNFFLFASKRI